MALRGEHRAGDAALRNNGGNVVADWNKRIPRPSTDDTPLHSLGPSHSTPGPDETLLPHSPCAHRRGSRLSGAFSRMRQEPNDPQR